MKTFSGSPFAIGRQMGAYYKDCRFQFPPVSEPELLNKQLAFYQKAAPEIIEEFRGIADGGGFDFNAVAHIFLVSEILYLRAQGQRACSIGGFRDAANNLWVVRNYDWHPAVAEVMQAWKFRSDGRDIVALTDMGILGEEGLNKSKQLFLYEDAINSDGLYIGVTFAFCWNEGVGLTSFDTVRLVSWRCKTVHEALEFFEKTKLASAKNFFIADAQGDMAVVQHAVDSYEVITPDADGLLAVTNHYIGRLEKQDQIRAADPANTTGSFARHALLMKGMKEIKKKPVGFDQLDAMMTGDTALSTYADNPNVKTVWNLTMNMTARKYHLVINPKSSARKGLDLVLRASDRRR